MPTSLSVKKLVYQVTKNHDPEAFASLYDLFVGRIYRFIFFKVNRKEEAEDLVSEVFLKTWQYLTEKTEKDIKSFSGLIYQIARNSLVDWYRAKANRAEFSLEAAPDVEELPGEDKMVANLMVAEDAKVLLKQVRQLKQEYQEVVLLRYIEELSIKEIAQIVKKSPINVRVTLHRATNILKKTMQNYEAP